MTQALAASDISPLSEMRGREVSAKDFNDIMALLKETIERDTKEPHIHRLVAEILGAKRPDGNWKIGVRDYENEVKALFDWVRSHVRYQHDPYGLETFRRSLRTLQLGMGDCDDFTILLGSLLQAAGYPIRIKVVDLSGSGWEHVYLLAGVPPGSPTRWLALDATTEHPAGWEVPASQVRKGKVYQMAGLGNGSPRVVPTWAYLFLVLGVIGLAKILGWF